VALQARQAFLFARHTPASGFIQPVHRDLANAASERLVDEAFSKKRNMNLSVGREKESRNE
jgi:hypothetical protein